MAAPLARMFPPADGRHTSIQINGRTYASPVGVSLDVPTFDAHQLSANGWTRVGATAFVGPTSGRPTASAGSPLGDGQLYFDTTLQVPVIWQVIRGFTGVWRNIFTGAIA